MPKFGNTSKLRLLSCDEKLQMLCFEAIAIKDFSVVCGHRNEEDQEEAFAKGFSKARWGESKHNTYPSRAVDIAPYNNGIDWGDTNEFYELSGIMKALAFKHNIEIRWGGNFEGFFDGAHFELV